MLPAHPRRSPTGRRWLLALLLPFALLLAACGSDSDGGADTSAKTTTTAATEQADDTTTTAAADALEGEITVSAAASLTESFTEIGKDFEADHPGTKVTLTFDSSGTLAQQILDGAPVDVFASADEANMTKLTDADLIAGDPVTFARNQLVIVTKPGNPAGITSMADLATVDGTVALCGADVPCGKFAGQALEGAGVSIDEAKVTRGQNVKATLAAVTEGDAVAAIVYVTDAVAAGDSVTAVDIPEAQNVIATYPIGVLSASEHADLADAFTAYVASDDGQMVLKEHGFLAPT